MASKIGANNGNGGGTGLGTPLRLVHRGEPTHGLRREVIEEISWRKSEPNWMLGKRLEAFAVFERMPLPTWGPDLSAINLDEIVFYHPPESVRARRWEDVPADIKDVYNKIGIPEAEQKYLAGVVAVRDQEPVYEHLKRQFEKMGIIFVSMETAVTKYPELVEEHFMKRNVPVYDNKFAALHAAVWSGGSFVYIPAGVKLDIPLQAYFRIEGKQVGTFEHTLIIAEADSQVHYIEGCTAQQHSTNKLHSAVVEVFVKDRARARYTTVQNWSKDVYNLNTKRALVTGEDAIMEWVGGSLGSGVTMLYPAS
ncbi:MAG: Fe-S cluster assembly protein SufB, partial [Chloroflexota bacterium]